MYPIGPMGTIDGVFGLHSGVPNPNMGTLRNEVRKSHFKAVTGNWRRGAVRFPSTIHRAKVLTDACLPRRGSCRCGFCLCPGRLANRTSRCHHEIPDPAPDGFYSRHSGTSLFDLAQRRCQRLQGQFGASSAIVAAVQNVKLWTFRRAAESGEPNDVTLIYTFDLAGPPVRGEPRTEFSFEFPNHVMLVSQPACADHAPCTPEEQQQWRDNARKQKKP